MQNSFKKFFFQSLFFQLLFISTIHATPKDSTKISASKYISEIKEYSSTLFFQRDLSSYIHIDTSITNFQRYTPAFYNLGNSGLPAGDLFSPKYSNVEDGFKYDNDFMDSYRITNNSIRYYDTKAPYTELSAVIGAKQEQFFNLLYTQNANKNLNFTLNFNRVRSLGSYLSQSDNDNSLALSSSYKTTNKKYFLTTNIIYNNFQYDENGGITNDSALANTTLSNRQLVPVNLSAAQHRIISTEFNLKQRYYFGSTTETMKPDSSFEKNFFPKSSLTHSFSIGKKSIVYKDNNPKSGIYKNAIDTLETLDSTHYYHIENELAWNTWNRIFDFTANLKHQLIGLKQATTDSVFSNIIAGGDLRFKNNFFEKILPYFNMDFNGNYDVYGNRKGDYSGTVNLENIIPLITITASIQRQTPDFIYDLYSGNNFAWKNNFLKTDQKTININYILLNKKRENPFSIGVAAAQYTHFCYFDNYAQPEQYAGKISVFSADLKKDFVYKKWTFSNNITYQYIPDSLPLRLPAWVSQNALYYSGNYKKVLFFNLGVDLFYNSAYFGNAYMPATGQFYLQNEKKIGDAPYLDFFVNVKIKTVRVFIKYQHFNSGLTGYNYYSALHYPMPDNAIKFGLSWQFSN